jgi:AAA15 family ATPase/GTPase
VEPDCCLGIVPEIIAAGKSSLFQEAIQLINRIILARSENRDRIRSIRNVDVVHREFSFFVAGDFSLRWE